MKITRTTKVQQGKGIYTTTIPATISEILGIQKGSILEWTMKTENEIKLKIKEETNMYKRYEISLEGETFVIAQDTNSIDEYEVFLVTPRGATQNQEYYTPNTQKLINKIYDNITEYATQENEITNPEYRY